ncbi:MAG: acetate/propionate family kinase [Planctomycetota bacterium]|nr:acetate/propionate family kinase [Planctomycetota bacterium]MDA1211469.1 acetate/propionate family kinase [Planctomycetota bacterium]
MKILVANLGSTSFKYRLFDFPSERQLARGGIDRIGQPVSHCVVDIDTHHDQTDRNIPDHAAAVSMCLEHLTHPDWGCLKDVSEVAAIGFKAVFAGKMSGIRIVTEELLQVMEQFSDVAPAHNPPYANAMRQLQKAFPQIPLVAALETAFHETIPPENRAYAIPYEWQEEYGIQRWGYHGASHRYIGGRVAQLMQRDDLRVISCHLGGSNSLSALKGGVSLANTLGMSPQSGLPHNNRVGDFDPFALPILMKESGKSLTELLDDLSNKSGLLGLSGLSSDVRDLEEAASKGNQRADLALKVFTQEIRRYLGGYLTILAGADAIVFTGGIGENSQRVRAAVCENLDWAGIQLDEQKNRSAKGECELSHTDSQTKIWVIPTNEELVVARQSAEAVGQMK